MNEKVSESLWSLLGYTLMILCLGVFIGICYFFYNLDLSSFYSFIDNNAIAYIIVIIAVTIFFGFLFLRYGVRYGLDFSDYLFQSSYTIFYYVLFIVSGIVAVGRLWVWFMNHMDDKINFLFLSSFGIFFFGSIVFIYAFRKSKDKKDTLIADIFIGVFINLGIGFAIVGTILLLAFEFTLAIVLLLLAGIFFSLYFIDKRKINFHKIKNSNGAKMGNNKTDKDKPLVFGMSMLKPPRTDDPYLVVKNNINGKEVSMSKNTIEDDFVSSSEGQNLHNELVKFQSSVGGLPALPTHSIEYEGWFKEVKKGIARKKEQQSLVEHTETIKRFSALHEEYLGLMKKYVSAQETKNEMILAKEKEKLIPLQIDVEKTKLAADKSDHELKIAQNQAEIAKLQNPKQAQPSIREQKEEELWLAQIQTQIDNIKNRPPKPEVTDPIVRKLEKIKEYEKKKEEMINEARTETEKSRIEKMFYNEIRKAMESN